MSGVTSLGIQMLLYCHHCTLLLDERDCGATVLLDSTHLVGLPLIVVDDLNLHAFLRLALLEDDHLLHRFVVLLRLRRPVDRLDSEGVALGM